MVRLAGKEFAIHAGIVAGIIGLRGARVQPCLGPPGWRGLLEWRGGLLPVYWPNTRMGVEERETGARTCLVLLGSKEAPREACWALRVDSVSRYEEVAQSYIRKDCKVRLNGKWRPVLNAGVIWSEWLMTGD